VVGLESDYVSLRKPGKNDRDVFQLHLVNILVAAMGCSRGQRHRAGPHGQRPRSMSRARASEHVPGGGEGRRRRKGQFEHKTAFYVRFANGAREIEDPMERERHIAGRWAAPAA
jgi:hypothetical protein